MDLGTIPRRSQRRDAQIPEAARPRPRRRHAGTGGLQRQCEMRDLGCGGGFCFGFGTTVELPVPLQRPSLAVLALPRSDQRKRCQHRRRKAESLHLALISRSGSPAQHATRMRVLVLVRTHHAAPQAGLSNGTDE
jgi:hypothetical protein